MNSELQTDEMARAVSWCKTLKFLSFCRRTHLSVSCLSDGSLLGEFVAKAVEESFSESAIESKRYARMVVCDCTDDRYADPLRRAQFLDGLDNTISESDDHCGDRVIVMAAVRPPKMSGSGVIAVAEREYDEYLSSREREDYWRDFYLEIEDRCRQGVKREQKDVVLIRVANVVGGDICTENGPLSIRGMVLNSIAEGKVVVSGHDERVYLSCIAPSDVFAILLAVTKLGKLGHVYNLGGPVFSLAQAKWLLHIQLAGKIGFRADICRGVDDGIVDSYVFSTLKLDALIRMRRQKIREIIYREAIAALGESYDMSRFLGQYGGKLEFVKDAELKMLRVVDDICQRHGIKYFLAGGTLLGAVRHGKMIPWDDDLDIGMLREEYEKFRVVVPRELPSEYLYESPDSASDKCGSHYFFDKIRMRGTYFSTQYSNRFSLNDGIFLDVVVYDRTSSVKLISNIHIAFVKLTRFALDIKWRDQPQKGKYPFITRCLLPIMRLLPFRFFHWLCERTTTVFKSRRMDGYLIDGGQNIKKGPFKTEYIADVMPIDFEGAKMPAPIGYDGYLKFLYGDNYMELLPISKRVSGHHFARIDLGASLFRIAENCATRSLAIEGELFE